jgi:PAS domain S-box-containing protein
VSATQHGGFERLISDLSNAFAMTAAEDVDRTIDTWLQRVAEFLELEAAAVSRFAADGRSAHFTHSWMAPGLPPLPAYLSHKDWPWVFDQLVKGQAVGYESTRDLPAEAEVDVQTYDRLSAKSWLTVPLSCGGTVLGALGLGTLRHHRQWPEPVTQRIRLVGEIFGAALARKRVQEKLQGLLKEWQITFDATNDALLVLDAQFTVVRANAAAAWFLNLSLEQIVGSQCHALMQRSCVPSTECPLQAAAGTKQRAERELRDEDRDAWYIVSADPILGAYGEISGFVYTMRDITQRKRAEVALTESQTLLAALVDSTVDMIWSVDPERFGLLTFNRGLQDYFHSRRDIDIRVGMPPDELLPPEYALRWCEFYLRALRDGSFVTEYETVSKTNTLLLSLNLLKREGKVFGISVFGKDITERKRSERDLAEAYRQIEGLKDQLQAENVYLREELSAATGHGEIIGTSQVLARVVAQARQVAPTDSSVLILGETGTGKELLAQFIHQTSRRSGKAFVITNLAAMPATLIEGELFGREKGAYTGALTRQVGRFEVADGGTIFLDEIGEMPMDTQTKLLRVLQSGEFERLGSSRTIRASVRVIAATNRDLVAAIRNGTFRQDLYYRLNVFPITVPPLRDRREDIPLLAQTFAMEFGQRMGKTVDRIRRRSLDALQAYNWPGNVRELRNVIERSMILTQGPELHVALPEHPSDSPPMQLQDMEKRHILQVLEKTSWRIRGPGGAAEMLGLKPTTLHSRMKKLRIQRRA